jgi:hypothetical protein
MRKKHPMYRGWPVPACALCGKPFELVHGGNFFRAYTLDDRVFYCSEACLRKDTRHED